MDGHPVEKARVIDVMDGDDEVCIYCVAVVEGRKVHVPVILQG